MTEALWEVRVGQEQAAKCLIATEGPDPDPEGEEKRPGQRGKKALEIR